MEETDILVYTLISLIESCREEQLKKLNDLPLPKHISLDETKILKNAMKYYKKTHSNTSLTSFILNYANSK